MAKSSSAGSKRSNEFQLHGEHVVEKYLEEDILEDEDAVASVEELYSDGEVWGALDLILETVEQQREKRRSD